MQLHFQSHSNPNKWSVLSLYLESSVLSLSLRIQAGFKCEFIIRDLIWMLRYVLWWKLKDLLIYVGWASEPVHLQEICPHLMAPVHTIPSLIWEEWLVLEEHIAMDYSRISFCLCLRWNRNTCLQNLLWIGKLDTLLQSCIWL